jgi:hypothetical protein
MRIVTHCSLAGRIELLFSVPFIKTLLEFLFTLDFKFLLMLQNVKSTELVKVFCGKSILAKTDE